MDKINLSIGKQCQNSPAPCLTVSSLAHATTRLLATEPQCGIGSPTLQKRMIPHINLTSVFLFYSLHFLQNHLCHLIQPQMSQRWKPPIAKQGFILGLPESPEAQKVRMKTAWCWAISSLSFPGTGLSSLCHILSHTLTRTCREENLECVSYRETQWGWRSRQGPDSRG